MARITNPRQRGGGQLGRAEGKRQKAGKGRRRKIPYANARILSRWKEINHIHLIFRSVSGQKPEALLGDFKRFTSNKIVKAIANNPQESRKEWMLAEFAKAAAKSSNVKHLQFWRHDNKPIELWSNKVIDEKINYVHNNPVEEGLVVRPEDYIYSSARDYSGEKGMLGNVVVVR